MDLLVYIEDFFCLLYKGISMAIQFATLDYLKNLNKQQF